MEILRFEELSENNENKQYQSMCEDENNFLQ